MVHWLSIHVCLLLSNQTFEKSEWDVVCNRSLLKPKLMFIDSVKQSSTH